MIPFEQLTIGELKLIHEQWKKQNPDIQTAEELLNDLNGVKGE
ncbi:MAG: hypothetical protein QQN41_08700 [Nitrosopumilus sp.]